MTNTNVKLSSKTGTSTIARARFGPGMLLQHEDLEQLNLYTRDLSRLMFQSLFGCGVICGLVVGTKEECGKLNVTVGAGVALSCSGDPVYVPKDESFPVDENCDPNLPSPLWVVLCSKVKCCAPRTAICSPEDEDAHAECTRERDGYEISVVRERPACACGCEEPLSETEERVTENECKCVNPYQDNLPHFKCYQAHYDGECSCKCADCTDCDCKCILLARIYRVGDTDQWLVDHRVRRFIRPVLMRDPQLAKDKAARTSPTAPTDPQTTMLFNKLSETRSEKEMIQIRQTWKDFSEQEKSQIRKVLEQVPELEKAPQFREILIKRQVEGPESLAPLQNEKPASQLAASLARVQKRSARTSKPGKTKES